MAELCDCDAHFCPHVAVDFKRLAADPRVVELVRKDSAVALLVYVAATGLEERDRTRGAGYSEEVVMEWAGELFPGLSLEDFRGAVEALRRHRLVYLINGRAGAVLYFPVLSELAEIEQSVTEEKPSDGGGEPDAGPGAQKRVGYLQ